MMCGGMFEHLKEEMHKTNLRRRDRKDIFQCKRPTNPRIGP